MGSKWCPVSHSDGTSISSLLIFWVCMCVPHCLFLLGNRTQFSAENSHPILVAILKAMVWVQRGHAVLWLSRAAQMAVFTSGTSAGKASSHSKWCCWLNILLSGDCHCQLHLGEFNKTGNLMEAKILRCTVYFNVHPKNQACIVRLKVFRRISKCSLTIQNWPPWCQGVAVCSFEGVVKGFNVLVWRLSEWFCLFLCGC